MVFQSTAPGIVLVAQILFFWEKLRNLKGEAVQSQAR